MAGAYPPRPDAPSAQADDALLRDLRQVAVDALALGVRPPLVDLPAPCGSAATGSSSTSPSVYAPKTDELTPPNMPCRPISCGSSDHRSAPVPRSTARSAPSSSTTTAVPDAVTSRSLDRSSRAVQS